jgi:translation initiation factor IF-1
VVAEAFANALFRVDIEGNKSVQARPAGKLRMNRIRILPGDRVEVEISSYDPTRGRITYRYR